MPLPPQKEPGLRAWNSIRENLDTIEEQREKIVELLSKVDQSTVDTELLSQQQSTVADLQQANTELIEEQHNHKSREDEFVNLSQSNFFNQGLIEGQSKTISDFREKIDTNHEAEFTEREQTIIDMQRSVIDLLEEKVLNLEIRNKKLSSGLSKMKGSYFNLSNLFKEKKAKEKESDDAQFTNKKNRLCRELSKLMKGKSFGRMLDKNKGKILAEVVFREECRDGHSREIRMKLNKHYFKHKRQNTQQKTYLQLRNLLLNLEKE
jgi:hypothetical protein